MHLISDDVSAVYDYEHRTWLNDVTRANMLIDRERANILAMEWLNRRRGYDTWQFSNE